jgi:hypothetical protein
MKGEVSGISRVFLISTISSRREIKKARHRAWPR